MKKEYQKIYLVITEFETSDDGILSASNMDGDNYAEDDFFIDDPFN